MAVLSVAAQRGKKSRGFKDPALLFPLPSQRSRGASESSPTIPFVSGFRVSGAGFRCENNLIRTSIRLEYDLSTKISTKIADCSFYDPIM